MAKKILLTSGNKQKMLQMINANWVEGHNTRWDSTTYTITDESGNVLATIEHDTDYGSTVITMNGHEIANIQWNANKKTDGEDDIFAVVNAAYARHEKLTQLRLAKQKLEQEMLALGIKKIPKTVTKSKNR